MARTVSVGQQDFERIRNEGYFYVDKTAFIREWWNGGDCVTLITRPRRFGKTLTMSMVEKFFSPEYAGRSGLFEGLAVWEDENSGSVWSLLVAGGYLKIVSHEEYSSDVLTDPRYEVALTNLEVQMMFRGMVRQWFHREEEAYNEFIRSLLGGDVESMNEYMNEVTQAVFSYFDTGKKPGKDRPERFYHGFVLGLMVELKGRYILTSNRESGFGRYDVMLEPVRPEEDAILIEFKVFRPTKEKDLSDTVKAALEQIEAKGYETALTAKGIAGERIRKYGFAFCGKQVLIGDGESIVSQETV